jgi:hypothetical protein
MGACTYIITARAYMLAYPLTSPYLTYRLVGLGCDELGAKYPVYRVLSVCCIAMGAFMLGGNKSQSGDMNK